MQRVPLPHAIFVPSNIKWAFPLQILFLFLQTLLSHRMYPNLFNPMFILLFSLAAGTFCCPPLSVSMCLEEIWNKPLLCPAPSVSSMPIIFSSERIFRKLFPTRCTMKKLQFCDLPEKRWRFGGPSSCTLWVV